MKSLKYHLTAVLILASILTISCGQKDEIVSFDANGYGQTELNNGLKVLVNKDDFTSLTAARVLIGGGVFSEEPSRNGISNLMIKMLLKGNSQMSVDAISEQLDFLGARVDANCYRDYTAITFVCLSENFEDVLKIIGTSVLSPTFPKEELEKLKVEVTGTIKAQDDNQTQSASKLFWKTMYGNEHYGMPLTGTVESVESISVADIRARYDETVNTGNITLSVSSDIPANVLIPLLETTFATLPKAEMPELSAQLTPRDEKEGFISYDRNQSFIFLGYPMPHLSAKEVSCMYLINEIMGRGSDARLWNLRREEKLAYAVYSEYALSKHCASFRAAIGTDTSKAKTAVASLKREMKKLYDEGITDAELAVARTNAKNSIIYDIDTKNGRTRNIAFYEQVGYGYKFPYELMAQVDRLTVDDVKNFIRSYFGEENQYLAIVGKK
ncbi:MAG: insulinase family protein [Candidatus Zixiibacteriota bacterium]|nr:MAG: insulinase family protein [candidate division Zixibacteria bacterium]